jgi:hypothetical protein
MNNSTDKQEVVDFFKASKIDEIELINDLNFLEEAILFILDKDTCDENWDLFLNMEEIKTYLPKFYQKRNWNMNFINPILEKLK